MRTTLDATPFLRSTIGFDRMLQALDAASRVQQMDSWPPYDIAKTGEDDYRITIAAAGFSRDELTVTQEQSMLVVAGQRAGEDKGEYLHRGIPGRAFQCRFELADHVKVVAANLENGVLTVDLRRELPEEMKPRRIAIAAATPQAKPAPRAIESGRRAA